VTPRDGKPIYDGWLAFYEFFFESFHWTVEDVNRCPIYLACILLGAIGPDQINVKMTFKDTMRYYSGDSDKLRMLKFSAGGSRGKRQGRKAKK
jgi:hypothetical protein